MSPLSIEQFSINGLLGCLLGTLAGWLNLLFLGMVFLNTPNLNHPSYWTALFGLCGIIAGAIQGGFLRRVTQPSLLWLLVSGTGWSIASIVFSQGSGSVATIGDLILAGLICGGIASLPQWLFLQRSLPFAAFWLVLSANTWSILLVLIRWSFEHFFWIPHWIMNHVPLV